MSPTNSELYSWTLRRDAIAHCLAEDVLCMQGSGLKGRVPCRSVRLIGTIVGIVGYESRRVYTIDDGSAVIECVHQPLPPSPSKKRSLKSGAVCISSPLPPPVSSVGRPVMIVGVIRQFRSTKQILVDQIQPCTSVNDEIAHWKQAYNLRKTYYFIEAPFDIPEIAEIPPHSSSESTSIACRPQATSAAMSHLGIIPPPPCSNAASISTSSSSKPASQASLPKSPPKLRHPTRLHTRDLTANTFRIYLKYYMHNRRAQHDKELREKFRFSDSSGALSDRKHILKQTPSPVFEEGDYGFTLSYLRRVPELRDMARKVIDAEDKIKRREERKLRAEAQLTGDHYVSKTQAREQRKTLNKHERVKMLFRQAVIKLCDEGSIVIFDGPKLEWKSDSNEGNSRLWKMDASSDVTSSWTGNTTLSYDRSLEDDELSDPSPEEESYVSLSPSYLGKCVETVIRDIMARSSAVTYKLSPQKGPTRNEILASLRSDARWRRVDDWAVNETLLWLQEEERVWDVGDGHWELTI